MGNIFIPKKIKVGFQNRTDTYTTKLAYVIYFDEKGKLRKETSWESWRDKKIDPVEFDNTPTPGFVLNKKVGGYKYDWNVRNTYVRVYDPRDFEFEITIPNLLFILENSNSIKGKGLEGEFVYGWSGTELLLVPTSSPDYAELSKINNLRHNPESVNPKDLILGATYLTKANDQVIFMGKFKRYSFQRYYPSDSGKDMGNHYFFMHQKNKELKPLKSISGQILCVVDPVCVSNYAELFDAIEKSPEYSPMDPSKTTYEPYDMNGFLAAIRRNSGQYVYVPAEGRFSTASSDYIELRPWCYRVHSGYVKFNSYRPSIDVEYQSIEKAFEELKPHYRKEFLRNGNLHSNSK